MIITLSQDRIIINMMMATNTYLLIFFLGFTNTRKKLDMLFPFLCIVAECQW